MPHHHWTQKQQIFNLGSIIAIWNSFDGWIEKKVKMVASIKLLHDMCHCTFIISGVLVQFGASNLEVRVTEQCVLKRISPFSVSKINLLFRRNDSVRQFFSQIRRPYNLLDQ